MKTGQIRMVLPLLLILGCQDAVENEAVPERSGNSNNFAAENMIINRQDTIENLERFELFLKNGEDDNEDVIRIITYTTEGDPVYRDLLYQNGKYISSHDSTRDSYGSGNKSKMECDDLIISENQERIDYVLEDCDSKSQDSNVLTIWK